MTALLVVVMMDLAGMQWTQKPMESLQPRIVWQKNCVIYNTHAGKGLRVGASMETQFI
jgi:hypothetical protein